MDKESGRKEGEAGSSLSPNPNSPHVLFLFPLLHQFFLWGNLMTPHPKHGKSLIPALYLLTTQVQPPASSLDMAVASSLGSRLPPASILLPALVPEGSYYHANQILSLLAQYSPRPHLPESKSHLFWVQLCSPKFIY